MSSAWNSVRSLIAEMAAGAGTEATVKGSSRSINKNINLHIYVYIYISI